MEQTLLKDMPEHMERIEDSFLFRQDIKDSLSENTCVLYVKSEDTHFDETNAIDEEDFGTVTESIITSLIDFVNQNYEWKGIKA